MLIKESVSATECERRIRKEGKKSIYGNINKKGSKEKNKKKDDGPKQSQLDAAAHHLIYRLVHLNARKTFTNWLE